jgi:hypothetical protein
LIEQRIPGCAADVAPNQDPNNAHQTNHLFYRIRSLGHSGNNMTKLSDVFGALIQLKAQKVIADFALTRASLEQVFIYFAKFQLGGGYFQKIAQQITQPGQMIMN